MLGTFLVKNLVSIGPGHGGHPSLYLSLLAGQLSPTDQRGVDPASGIFFWAFLLHILLLAVMYLRFSSHSIYGAGMKALAGTAVVIFAVDGVEVLG